MDRITCCVIGCKHTRKKEKFSEWICRNHWKNVPLSKRKEYSSVKRKFQKTNSMENINECIEKWNEVKDFAIDAAIGLK